MFALNVQTNSQSDNIPNINCCLWEPELGNRWLSPTRVLDCVRFVMDAEETEHYSDAGHNYVLPAFLVHEQ